MLDERHRAASDDGIAPGPPAGDAIAVDSQEKAQAAPGRDRVQRRGAAPRAFRRDPGGPPSRPLHHPRTRRRAGRPDRCRPSPPAHEPRDHGAWRAPRVAAADLLALRRSVRRGGSDPDRRGVPADGRPVHRRADASPMRADAESRRIDEHHQIELEPVFHDELSLTEPMLRPLPSRLCRAVPDLWLNGSTRVCMPTTRRRSIRGWPAWPRCSATGTATTVLGRSLAAIGSAPAILRRPCFHRSRSFRVGVPKRKVSKARQGERRSHLAISAPPLVECEHCHELHRAHHVCPTCGWYNGREAVTIEAVGPAEGQRSRPMRIAVDAMGGDHAPREIVRGAIDYAMSTPADEVILVGDVARIEARDQPKTAAATGEPAAGRCPRGHRDGGASCDRAPNEAPRLDRRRHGPRP